MATKRRLEGKVALITGAASGFGLAIATRFAQEGCSLMMTDMNMEPLEKAAQAIIQSNNNVPIIARQLNVTSAPDWTEAVKACDSFFHRLDIVVNNAGTSYRNKPTLEVTEDDFDKVMNVNVKSIYHSVNACVPEIMKHGEGGSVINISSTGSKQPRPGLVWYNASKGAVTIATKGLAAEYGPKRIRFNAICPVLSGTGLFSTFVGVEDTPENRASFTSNVPLGRLCDPTDVANAALYLASDEASFVTGVNLEVDGGKTI